MQYDKSIDRIRGILVFLMIYAHMLQFFGNNGAFPAEEYIINTINILVFPTFVFCFGRTSAIAYLSKPYKAVVGRMAKTLIQLYGVFVLSGLGFRLMVDRAPFNTITVEKVLLLSDMPGWSEFLAGFAAYAFVLLVFFIPLKRLSTRLLPTLLVSAACLACCFLPYDKILAPQLGLFIGSRSFACFPVVQYAPYLLIGIFWQTTHKNGKLWAILGFCASLAGIIWTATQGLPERFPPSLPWVLLTGAFPVLMSWLMPQAEKLPHVLHRADGCLCNIGRKSLFYLLTSNLTIFALSSLGAVPMVTKKNIWFWKQSIASPFGALLWTLILLVGIGLLAALAGKSSEKRSAIEKP